MKQFVKYFAVGMILALPTLTFASMAVPDVFSNCCSGCSASTSCSGC